MEHFTNELLRVSQSDEIPPEDVWKPSPHQQKVLDSEADVLLFGGAAGGGKSALLQCIPMYYPGSHAILFRRNYTDLKSSIEELTNILEPHGGHVTRDRAEFPNGARTFFGHFDTFADISKWRGQANELMLFDELTEMDEAGFRVLQGWVRSARGIRTRVIAGSNPPVLNLDTGEVTGLWVLDYWRPWLDRGHPNPAEPGELRYFCRGIDRESGLEVDVEVSSKEPVPFSEIGGPPEDDRLIYPHSRTFIPAKVADNPYLAGTEYERQLDALPRELRYALRDGNWSSSNQFEDAFSIIPAAWIRQSHALWRKRVDAEGNPPRGALLQFVGVDPSRGGQDATVIIKRYTLPDGTIFIGMPKRIPGRAVPDGDAVASAVVAEIATDSAQKAANLQVRVDAIGIGSSVVDALRNHGGFRISPLNGSWASTMRPRGAAQYAVKIANARSEWYWRLREGVEVSHSLSEEGAEPIAGPPIELPPDQQIFSELRATRWKPTKSGIALEEKDQIRKRLRRSPDAADALSYALADPPAVHVAAA